MGSLSHSAPELGFAAAVALGADSAHGPRSGAQALVSAVVGEVSSVRGAAPSDSASRGLLRVCAS